MSGFVSDAATCAACQLHNSQSVVCVHRHIDLSTTELHNSQSAVCVRRHIDLSTTELHNSQSAVCVHNHIDLSTMHMPVQCLTGIPTAMCRLTDTRQAVV